jgi:hypothetical protein
MASQLAKRIALKQFYLSHALRLLDKCHSSQPLNQFDKKMYDQLMLVHRQHRIEDVNDELSRLQARMHKLSNIKTERDLMIRE